MAVKFAPPGSRSRRTGPTPASRSSRSACTAPRWRPATLVGHLRGLRAGQHARRPRPRRSRSPSAWPTSPRPRWSSGSSPRTAEPDQPATAPASVAPLAHVSALTARDADTDQRPRLEPRGLLPARRRLPFASALGAVLAGAAVGLLEDGDAIITGRAVLASHLAALLLIVPLAMRLPRPAASAGSLEVAHCSGPRSAGHRSSSSAPRPCPWCSCPTRCSSGARCGPSPWVSACSCSSPAAPSPRCHHAGAGPSSPRSPRAGLRPSSSAPCCRRTCSPPPWSPCRWR